MDTLAETTTKQTTCVKKLHAKIKKHFLLFSNDVAISRSDGNFFYYYYYKLMLSCKKESLLVSTTSQPMLFYKIYIYESVLSFLVFLKRNLKLDNSPVLDNVY